MNLPDGLLSSTWYIVAWVLWLPLIALALYRSNWQSFREGERLNLWLGMVVAVMLLWSMKAGVKPGLDMHLTGVMVFTLVFDAPLAFVGLNLVLLGVTLNGSAGWQGFALNALLTAGVGVGLSTLVYRCVDALLPKHFFIFIFFKAYFGAALAIMGIGLAFTALYVIGGVYSWSYLFDDYLPFYLLLGFSEAWISGMVITLMLVYRQGWVGTFDDSKYLSK